MLIRKSRKPHLNITEINISRQQNEFVSMSLCNKKSCEHIYMYNDAAVCG